MVEKALLAIGALSSAICISFALIVGGIGSHYNPGVWSGPLVFGSISVLPIAAIFIHLHVYRAKRRKRPADRRTVLAGFVVGAILALGGGVFVLRDSGDYFLYLPFALSGIILLWVCGTSGLARSPHGHPPPSGGEHVRRETS